MSHILVTNDFPPKLGGIQSYLWELWRRLAADRFAVLTTPFPGADGFDSAQPFRVERTRHRVLFPTPGLAGRVNQLAAETNASLAVLDPALPLGRVGRQLAVPYTVVVHGAEVSVPGRLPVSHSLLAAVLGRAAHVVAAGGWVADQAERVVGHPLPTTVVPPGVDVDRFTPLGAEGRARARMSFGLPVDGRLVVSVSRLVPRKGMDTLIEAAARLAPLHPDLTVAIAGAGRDRGRLDRLVARSGAPVRLLGRVGDERLPSLYACADIFAMLCRNRWGGLEQEGFGIVFLEAAACGVPQVAGDSGGASEAVVDGETGLVVRRPESGDAAASTLARLLDDADLRRAQGQAARRRAEREYSYDVLAARLDHALMTEEARAR
ncbi:MAG: glycosyltransferase family 4 protein [Actinobacteria bacterium]|nr:MAG: glycosyltransferase family 4 protein [Actinomycetota bacterium]